MRNPSKVTYLAHIIILAAVTLAVLLPFADKAFHMDDTLFFWTARQIIERPWDFYGFQGTGDGTLAAAPEIIKTPPIAAYYMALAGWFAGVRQKTLPLAFMFPAFMAVWGGYALARRVASRELIRLA